jgi:uncharacterized protein
MFFFGRKKKKQKELKRQEELARQAEIEKARLNAEQEQIKKVQKQEELKKKAEKQKTEKQEADKKEELKKEKATKKPTKTSSTSKKGPSGKYEVYPEAGMYKYRLKASNGEILAVSFGYSTRKGAVSGIETFKKNVGSGDFEISTDKSGYSFYTLFNNTGARAILIGEFYNGLKLAESAVESVKNFYDTKKVVHLEEIPASEVREELVEIGEVESKPNGKYDIYEEDGNWFVRLKASNGETLFISQGYASKSSAMNGLDTIKNAIDDKYFTIAKDKQNRYQFKLYSSRKQLILFGETYPVKRSCTSAIDSVIRFSSKAKINEL